MTKQLYKVLSGTHAEGDQVYEKGELVPSSRNLAEMFVNKFEPVGKFTPATVEDPPTTEEPPTSEEDIGPAVLDSKEDKPPAEDFGIDVTEQFPEAGDHGLQVFKKRGWFSIREDGIRCNDKGLKEADVPTFLAGYLAEDDEDAEDDDF